MNILLMKLNKHKINAKKLFAQILNDTNEETVHNFFDFLDEHIYQLIFKIVNRA